VAKAGELVAQAAGVETVASLPCPILRSRRGESGEDGVILRTRCAEKAGDE
jgi:hypothetical protein